jgi:methionyl-tRNA synthetase
MPTSAAKLLDALALAPEARSFDMLGAKGRLSPGTAVPEPQGVFPRYVDPEEAAKAGAAQPKPKKGKAEKS